MMSYMKHLAIFGVIYFPGLCGWSGSSDQAGGQWRVCYWVLGYNGKPHHTWPGLGAPAERIQPGALPKRPPQTR